MRGDWPGFAIPLTFGLVNPTTVWFGSLWLAAGLTVVTGWDYLRVDLKHMD